ncbi:tetratricopeptide repeat protein [Algibacter miyuki]|nr:tetratricopeptide repeat protein [Algibacter miyuki]MDN3666091.1 tetratricopeptide repeat protein [Algibacter miyuki]
MDYQYIIELCKIIAVVLGVLSALVGGFGLWAYFKNKQVEQVVELEAVKRNEHVMSNVENNTVGLIENKKDVSMIKEEVSNLKAQLRELLDERRQQVEEYLSREQQDEIIRNRFNVSGADIEMLIEKATQKSETYITQAMGYELNYDYGMAELCYIKALEVAVQPVDKADILFSLGGVYYHNGDHLKATQCYKDSIVFYGDVESKSAEDLWNLSYIYSSLGIIEKEKSKYLKAIEFYKRALNLREKLVDLDYDKYVSDLAKIYMNFAVTYGHIRESDKAIAFSLKAIDIFKTLDFANEIDTKLHFVSCYSNLGNIYKNQNDFENAKDSFQKTLKILGDPVGNTSARFAEIYAGIHLNYGEVLYELNDNELASFHVNIGVKIFDNLFKISPSRYRVKYLGSYYSLGKVLRQGRRYNDCILLLENLIKNQASDLLKDKYDLKMIEANIYFLLGQSYHESRVEKGVSLNYFKKAYAIYSMFSESSEAEIWKQQSMNYIDLINKKSDSK